MMTNREFANMLRELADLYEANPALPQLYTMSRGVEAIFANDRESFAAAVRVFGRGNASIDGDWLVFRPDSHPTVQILWLQSVNSAASQEEIAAYCKFLTSPAKDYRSPEFSDAPGMVL